MVDSPRAFPRDANVDTAGARAQLPQNMARGAPMIILDCCAAATLGAESDAGSRVLYRRPAQLQGVPRPLVAAIDQRVDNHPFTGA